MKNLVSFDKSSISFKEKLISVFYILISIVFGIFFMKINLNEFQTIKDILMIPLTVLSILVIHELIHISMFKLFGKGFAKISVIYEKEMGAIAIYQSNKDVKYSLIQTLIILLTPAIALTIIGMSFLLITTIPLIVELIKINIILNIVGSHIDFLISCKLLKSFYKKNVLVFYDYKKEVGMSINIEY